MYVAEAPGPSPLPHSPAVGGRGRLPKLFDHTLSADIRQYNHLPISIARNFVIIIMHDHDTLFRHIDTATESESGPDFRCRRDYSRRRRG